MQYSSKRVKWMINTVTDCLGRKKEDVDVSPFLTPSHP